MKKDPWFRNRLIRDGLYAALYEQMEFRDEIFILGEGSHMKIHFDAPTIEKDFPGRSLTMPISEDGNTNFAVGMALRGVVPVVDVISSDFLFRTMDSICNTAAKVNYVHDPPFTIVIRAEFLTGGPTTGQRIEEMFCHVPGLRVGVPSNPLDAYLMMNDALRHPGVTILFEDRVIEDATTPEDRKRPLGVEFTRGARVRRREGAKVTVASYGLLFRRCETALIDDPRVELVDLRWLAPLSWKPDDKPLVLVTPTEISTLPHTMLLGVTGEPIRFTHLHGALATIPASRELHDELVPSDAALRTCVDRILAPRWRRFE